MDAGTRALAEPLVSQSRGDAGEFAELAVRSSGLAFRIAYSVLRQPDDSEEIAQEALLSAHRNFSRLRKPEMFRSWLIRTTWRLALDRVRSMRRRERREREAGLQSELLDRGEGNSLEFRCALAEEIERLPRKLRQVVLAAAGGYNTKEMARQMDLPEGTVKSRLFLARKRLAERLEWAVEDTKKR